MAVPSRKWDAGQVQVRAWSREGVGPRQGLFRFLEARAVGLSKPLGGNFRHHPLRRYSSSSRISFRKIGLPTTPCSRYLPLSS